MANKMAADEGRCGPLCQHPGCWYSREKNRLKLTSNRNYHHYLSGLLLRQKPFQERPHSDGGLPTLKVQTLAEDVLPPDHHVHRRAKTLPPVRTHARSHNEPHIVRKPFNFVQMTLEDEEEEEERRRGQEEITFSPVLVWKPGRRSLMKKHHRRSDTAPQENGDEGGVGRGETTRRRRNPITLKTTDLADALPPERSDEAVEKKATPKSWKGHQRLTTADAESFGYLADIPPEVVAEIMQQLRSESSSSVYDLYSQLITTPTHTPIHQSRSMQTTTVTDDTTNIPSSLIYDLSSKKLKRTSDLSNHAHPSRSHPAATNRKTKLTSFSRELSERPLEVLMRGRQSIKMKPIEEGEGLRASTKLGMVEEGQGLQNEPCGPREPPLPKSKKQSHTSLLTAPIQPSLSHTSQNPHPSVLLAQRVAPSHSDMISQTSSVRYPYGNPVVPRVPQRASYIGEAVYRDISMGYRETERQAELNSEVLLQTSPHVSPRLATFEGGKIRRGGTEDHTKSRVMVKTKKAKDSQSPRQKRGLHRRLPTPARSYTQRPFSEESSVITPEVQPVPQENSTHNATTEHTERRREGAVERSPISASVSPDYMLVGARFSGGRLVLVDKNEQIVHQLTDTESDANLAFSDVNMAISEAALLTPSHTLHTHKDSQVTDETKPPPSSATYTAARWEKARQLHPVEIPVQLTEEHEEEDIGQSSGIVVDERTDMTQHGGTQGAVQQASIDSATDTTQRGGTQGTVQQASIGSATGTTQRGGTQGAVQQASIGSATGNLTEPDHQTEQTETVYSNKIDQKQEITLSQDLMFSESVQVNSVSTD